MTDEQALIAVLAELVEQIDSFESIRFTRDTEQYKSQAVWDYTLIRARNLVRKMKRPTAVPTLTLAVS